MISEYSAKVKAHAKPDIERYSNQIITGSLKILEAIFIGAINGMPVIKIKRILIKWH